MREIILSILFSLVWVSNLQSTPVANSPSDSLQNGYTIENISILNYPKGPLTIDDIQKDSIQNLFERTKTIGKPGNDFWLKTSIYNSSNSDINSILSVYPYEYIEIYYRNPDNRLVSKRNGIAIPTNERDYKDFFDAFSITLLKKSFTTIYIHIKNKSTDDPKIKILSINAIRYRLSNETKSDKVQLKVFREESVFRSLISKWFELAAFLGFIAAMFIYNFFVLFYTKDRIYIYYNLMTFGIIIFYVNYSNLAPHILPLSFTTQEILRTMFGSSLIAVGMILFSKNFLNTKVSFPKWNYLLNIFLYLFVVIIVIRLICIQFGFYNIYYYFKPIFNNFTIVMTSSLLVLCTYAYYHKYPSAEYYLISNLAYFSFHLIFVLQGSFLGIFKESWFTRSSLEIGYMLQTMFFSLSLAARLRILKQEKENAERQKIIEINELTIAKNIELEQIVATRTAELKRSNEEIANQRDSLKSSEQTLKDLIATKDKFFSIIAHDLRGPISTLNSFIEHITNNKSEYTNESINEILLILKDSTQNTYSLLENLLTWARSQKGEIPFNPSQNNIISIINLNVQLFQATSDSKKIKTIFENSSEVNAFFDYDMVNTVIRNLYNNAIKYSHEYGTIKFNIQQFDNKVEVSIEDFGTGIEPELLNNLFRIDVKSKSVDGTSGEKGTGLGLILCKEFIEKNAGNFRVESEVGKGTRFIFSLPIAG